MKKISLKVLIFIFILMVLANANWAEAKILASVGAEKITIDDFKERLAELPPQFQGYYASEKGKNKFLDQLIQERLFYLEAKKKGVAKEKEIAEAIERARKNIIVSYYVNKVLKNVVVNDKELKKYYNKNRSKYISPAKVRASHILVESKQKALEIIKKIKAGGNFEALAKKYSKDPNASETADVSWFEKGQMVEAFEKAAFALAVGKISVPVQTQYGYHVIKVTEKMPQKQKTFEQVKATIREELLRQAQNDKLDKMVAKLKTKTQVNIDQQKLSQF